LELQIARKFKPDKNYSWLPEMGQTFFIRTGLILIKKFIKNKIAIPDHSN